MQSGNYTFAQLDSRNIPAAHEANDRILGTAETENSVLGIEVTVPALAERCGLGNIDPQHSEGLDQAAVEVALGAELPPPGSTLVTVRPDIDAVASMAILDLRSKGGINLSDEFAADVIERVAEIARRDRFDNGVWSGKGEYPSRENPWPAGSGASPEMAALSALVADFKVPLNERVEAMQEYLLAGYIPESYEAKVAQERVELIDALEKGEIQVQVEQVAGLDVAVVHSHHKAGTAIGYLEAPVVVAINDQFSLRGSDPHRKITIAQFHDSYIDTESVKETLAAIEPGVGGSKTLLGSRQGEQSDLTVEQILEAIKIGREQKLLS